MFVARPVNGKQFLVAMNNEICDYLFHDNPRFAISGPCIWTSCVNSMFYRIVRDILKNSFARGNIYTHMVMRKSYYTMCVENDRGHVHDAAFVTINTKTERAILNHVLTLFTGADRDRLVDMFFGKETETVRHIISSCVVCGSVYTTSFMEHRNNDLSFDHSLRKEKTFYIYDCDYNRGHKFYVEHGNDAALNVVNRDGAGIKFESLAIDDAALYDYIYDCVSNSWHSLISPSCTTVSGYIEYLNASTRHVVSLDYFINKKYMSAAESLHVLLNKLNILENEKYRKPLWNLKEIPILMGKIPIGHTQEYEKTSGGRLVDTKRKVGSYVEKNKYFKKSATSEQPAVAPSLSTTGSKRMRSGETTIQRMDCENVPSFFKTLNALHIADSLSDYVQRNVPKNVRTVEARILPPDSYKYLDIQCLGSINNSGKSAAFVDGVKVSYGYSDDEFATKVIAYMESNCDVYSSGRRSAGSCTVVVNKIITKYHMRVECDFRAILDVMVHVKKNLNKFCMALPFSVPGETNAKFLSIHFMPGIPFRSFKHLSRDNDVMFARREIDILYSVRKLGSLDHVLNYAEINCMIDADDRGGMCSMSKISMRSSSNRMYVLPSKQTVAVNGYKTGVPDTFFMIGSNLISKTTQYFIDYEALKRRYVPMGCSTIADAYQCDFNVSEWARPDTQGYISIPVGVNVRRDCVPLPTVYADIRGKNVEDAYVISKHLDLGITVMKNYNIQFTCKSPVVRIYHAADGCNPMIVSSRDRETAYPLTVTVLVATIKNIGDNSDPAFLNTVRVNGNVYTLNSVVDSTDSLETFQDVVFQPFKKINIYKASGGEYMVYVQFCDQYIVDRVREYEAANDNRCPSVRDIFDTYDVEYCKFSDVQEQYCANYYRAPAELDFTCAPEIYYIKLQITMRVPTLSGLKLYTFHGYKGVSTPDDFAGSEIVQSIGRWADLNNIPGLVVANNVAMESRAMMGDMLDMTRNFTQVIRLDTGEEARVGYVNYIVSGLVQPCQASRLKFDIQTQNSMLANGLESAINSKYADNIYNLNCLTIPDPSRQIMDNFKLTGVFFDVDGSVDNHGTADDVRAVETMYNEICNLKRK